MKVILVKPTQTGRNLRRQVAAYEPLGLEYLAAWVRKKGFKAEIFDMHIQNREIKDLGDGVFRVGMNRDEIKQKFIKENPDIIGISCLFREYSFDVLDIINLCKETLPNAYIVLGGQDAATRPESYFKSSAPDLIVSGEGELTFEDILMRLSSGGELRQIPGTIEYKDGSIIKNCGRERIKDLDELSLPERDLSAYLNPKIQKITYPFAKRLPATIIQSSRGCLMKCAFCDIISVWNKWTFRSPKSVVDEIEHLSKKFGISEFSFIDDNFMLNKERIKGICEEIIDRELHISFEVNPGISVWTIDKKIIDLMVQAGLYRICLPVESGSETTLKFIGKPVDLKKTRELIQYCNSLGLYTYGNILIGFPFERKEEIEESIRWAFASNLDMVHFLIAEPYEGASMFSVYRENNWIEFDSNENFSMRKFRTKYFTIEELNKIRNRAQLQYFLKKSLQFFNPIAFKKSIWPKINSLSKLKYFLKISLSVVIGSAIPENFAPFKLFARRKQVLLNYR